MYCATQALIKANCKLSCLPLVNIWTEVSLSMQLILIFYKYLGKIMIYLLLPFQSVSHCTSSSQKQLSRYMAVDEMRREAVHIVELLTTEVTLPRTLRTVQTHVHEVDSAVKEHDIAVITRPTSRGLNTF